MYDHNLNDLNYTNNSAIRISNNKYLHYLL